MTSAVPSFPFENKVNTTERGEAEVMFERVTEIIAHALKMSQVDHLCFKQAS